MDETLTKEIINCIHNIKSQLRKDLVLMEEKLEGTRASLSRSSFLKLPRQWHLGKILRGIKKRISKQEREIIRYKQAESRLREGNPQLAMKILTELKDSTFSVWDIVIDHDGIAVPVHGTPNPPERFHRLEEFVKKLYFSQQNDSLD